MSSDSTDSGVAFFSPSFSISRFHPNAQTINPPPTWTAGSDTPKKASRCEPRKYEPAIKRKLFKVTRQDSSRRVAGRTDRVRARKIGLALNGSTIGNSALNTRKKAFMASCIRQLEISLFNETARPVILSDRGRKARLAVRATLASAETEFRTESLSRTKA